MVDDSLLSILVCPADRGPLVLVVVDVAGLVDQQHRNAVLDAVSTSQPRVVQQLRVARVDQQQRAPVSRAHQDAQQ